MGAAIGTRLFTLLKGQRVGQDEYGNVYYQERKNPASRRRKRWVVYQGIVEASKIPALWHGWLHYTYDELPTQMNVVRHAWEKPHQPNLTGTKGAYLPAGDLRAGGQRAASTSDYQAWTPK
jgi:NADH:ubiquinone oxidoreductase subunit